MEGQKHLNEENLEGPTLFTALESEISHKGLLHDLFMEIERMTIEESQNGGQN